MWLARAAARLQGAACCLIFLVLHTSKDPLFTSTHSNHLQMKHRFAAAKLLQLVKMPYFLRPPAFIPGKGIRRGGLGEISGESAQVQNSGQPTLRISRLQVVKPVNSRSEGDTSSCMRPLPPTHHPHATSTPSLTRLPVWSLPSVSYLRMLSSAFESP